MSDELPIIGRDIQWADVKQLPLLVREFLPLAERVVGSDVLGRAHVRAFGATLPYAILIVAAADRRQPIRGWNEGDALLGITHREDFRAIDEAFAFADADNDVFVFHVPLKVPWFMKPLRRGLPSLGVWVCVRDFFNRFDDPTVSPQDKFAGVLWKHDPSDLSGGRFGHE